MAPHRNRSHPNGGQSSTLRTQLLLEAQQSVQLGEKRVQVKAVGFGVNEGGV
jgi:hypothetical protein